MIGIRVLPGSWQFVQVDTAYDGVSFPAPMLPPENFIGLAKPGQRYADIVASLETTLSSPHERRKAFSGWLEPPPVIQINQSPGQQRAMGRAVSAAGLANLKSGLRSALDKLQAPENMSQLADLSKILHPKSGAGGRVKEPIVIVVSSIAGGSGAGMYMDVTETLKSIDSGAGWLQQQTAYLYTPEVFDSIPPQMRAQIPMNALGAMNEILSGLWSMEASEGTDALFNASGVHVLRPRVKGSLGPAGVFLVGSKNASGADISQGRQGAGMDEVFLAVGEAISGLVTDEDLADNYEAYFYTNVFANSGKDTTLADHTGLCRPTDNMERMPFGAIGFARVTLGMDRLMEYASEGLTKAHVNKLLFPVFEPVDPMNPVSDAERVENLAENYVNEFVSLIIATLESAASHQVDAFGLAADKKELLKWCELMHSVVLNQSAEAVSQFGLLVTVKLLSMFRVATSDLVRKLLNESGNFDLGESGTRIIKDFMTGVIDPIIEECDAAFAMLKWEITASSGSAARMYREFADLKVDRDRKSVSPRYMPRQVERMLIESDSFPGEFERLEKMDLLDDDRESWVTIVDAWSLKGVALRARDTRVQVSSAQTLFTVQQPWVPLESHARRDPSLGPQKMEVRLPRSLSELVERNRAWLEDRDSRFGRQYRMSISDYVKGGNTSEKLEKQKAFISAFTSLVQLSSPLITINQAAVSAFHHHSDPKLTPFGTTLHLTSIPFEEKSEVGRECAEVVLRLIPQGPPKLPFDQASTAKDLFGFATVKVAMSPMVYTSLIQPIADSWLTSSSNANSVHAFWDGRRARPLTESIPVSPEIRLSMITGWFIAATFDERRRVDPNSSTGGSFDVWAPESGWLPLPRTLLPVTAGDKSSIPAIMQSISIAMIEAGLTASTAPLEAYMRLKELGREVTATAGVDISERGVEPSRLISDWILKGELPEGAPAMPAFRPDVGAGDLSIPENRKEALAKDITLTREAYAAQWASLEKKDWRDIPRIYELKEDIDPLRVRVS
jgi:hypothetical protein